MDGGRARRLEILERLNAFDSGPHEDVRRAARESKRCMALLIEANKWPSTYHLGRTPPVMCSR
jgi:hypothetical protein